MKKTMQKQKNKKIFLLVFGYEDKTPQCIYTSKETLEKHVDLLLLSNSKNSHYIFIKDFDTFVSNKNKAIF